MPIAETELALPTPFSFSQSSLQDYFDCPRRFYLRYIAHLVWPAVESEPLAQYERRQQDGLLFHRLVQQHLLGVPADKIGRLASSGDLERWWANYLNSDLGLSGYSLHTELSLSSPIQEHRLLAKYDLLAVKSPRAQILDWKTYARRPREEQVAARWQTRVYRYLMRAAGGELNGGSDFAPTDIEMVYWFAEFPSEPIRLRYDEAQFRRDEAALTTMVDEISGARTFPQTEDRNMCRFCVYRSYCDRGREAGDWSVSPTESEAVADFDLNFEQIPEIEF